MAERLRRLTRNQFPSGGVGSSPTDCKVVCEIVAITFFSDGVVGDTVKHRFQHKLFIIHTVFQCYTDPPSMCIVSSVRYLSLRFLISRLFLIINRLDFLLRSEEWFGRNILTAKSIKCCCKGKDLQYT